MGKGKRLRARREPSVVPGAVGTTSVAGDWNITVATPAERGQVGQLFRRRIADLGQGELVPDPRIEREMNARLKSALGASLDLVVLVARSPGGGPIAGAIHSHFPLNLLMMAAQGATMPSGVSGFRLLEQLAVAQDVVGQGLGRQLVEAAAEVHRAQGGTRWIGFVSDAEQQARQFYSSVGFTVLPAGVPPTGWPPVATARSGWWIERNV